MIWIVHVQNSTSISDNIEGALSPGIALDRKYFYHSYDYSWPPPPASANRKALDDKSTFFPPPPIVILDDSCGLLRIITKSSFSSWRIHSSSSRHSVLLLLLLVELTTGGASFFCWALKAFFFRLRSLLLAMSDRLLYFGPDISGYECRCVQSQDNGKMREKSTDWLNSDPMSGVLYGRATWRVIQVGSGHTPTKTKRVGGISWGRPGTRDDKSDVASYDYSLDVRWKPTSIYRIGIFHFSFSKDQSSCEPLTAWFTSLHPRTSFIRVHVVVLVIRHDRHSDWLTGKVSVFSKIIFSVYLWSATPRRRRKRKRRNPGTKIIFRKYRITRYVWHHGSLELEFLLIRVLANVNRYIFGLISSPFHETDYPTIIIFVIVSQWRRWRWWCEYIVTRESVQVGACLFIRNRGPNPNTLTLMNPPDPKPSWVLLPRVLSL